MKHYTTGMVARLAKVAPRTVVRWFDKGLLKGWKVPGSSFRRFEGREVIAFFKLHKIPIPEELINENEKAGEKKLQDHLGHDPF